MRGNEVTTVSVAASDDRMRATITRALEEDPGFEVLPSATTLAQLNNYVASGSPAVVIAVAPLAGGTVIELAKIINKVQGTTRTLVVSESDDLGQVVKLLEAGIFGYWLKSASLPQIMRAAQDVAQGRLTFSPALTEPLRSVITLCTRPNGGEAGVMSRLTERESQILKHLNQGANNAEIAMALGIAKKTVETHVRSVLLKLGVKNRAQAAKRKWTSGPSASAG